MAQYLSCAQTAKLVRAALKEAFPGVKFSVKSSVYSGGASINVAYTDGPDAAQVEGVVGAFQGAYFDGMTDYKGCNYNTLDGQQVRFGADFIFVNRKFTYDTMFAIVNQVCNYYGFANQIIIKDGGFGAYIQEVCPNDDSQARGFTTYDIDRIIRDAASKYSMDDAAESATLNRVAFLGDDGYGYGSVGRISQAPVTELFAN